MQIHMFTDDGEYGFILTSEDQVVFASNTHHVLTDFVKPLYSSAAACCYDARKLVRGYPQTIKFASYEAEETLISDISSEEMWANHYADVLGPLGRRIEGAQEANDQEELELYHKEATILLNEVENVYDGMKEEREEDKQIDLQDQKNFKVIQEVYKLYLKFFQDYFHGKKAEVDMQAIQNQLGGGQDQDAAGGEGGLPGLAQTKDRLMRMAKEGVANNLKEELLETYGERAADAIQDLHPGSFYTVNEDKVEVVSPNKQIIVSVIVSDTLTVNSVIPSEFIRRELPMHSGEYYQKYWKPIVENIGHIIVGDNILLVPQIDPLPDVPMRSKSNKMMGWNTETEEPQVVEVSFKKSASDSNHIWIVGACEDMTKQAVSRYTEQDYAGALVKCIDKSLESLYGHIGEVIQVIPFADHVEIDVEFTDIEAPSSKKILTDETEEEQERLDSDLEENKVIRMDESQVAILKNEI